MKTFRFITSIALSACIATSLTACGDFQIAPATAAQDCSIARATYNTLTAPGVTLSAKGETLLAQATPVLNSVCPIDGAPAQTAAQIEAGLIPQLALILAEKL
jgi:hypothetical protein